MSVWIVDNREPDEMKKYIGVYKQATLDVGDYVYEEIGFERKEMDFVNAEDVIAKASELMVAYPYHYLIVTDNLNSIIAKYNRMVGKNMTHQVLGLVASLAVRGIPPIFTSNRYFGAYIMKKIAEKTYDGKIRTPENEIRKIRTRVTNEDWKMNVLLGLPNVGEVRAKKLLIHFKTIENIVNADIGELKEVLGPTTAEKVWEVLHK